MVGNPDTVHPKHGKNEKTVGREKGVVANVREFGREIEAWLQKSLENPDIPERLRMAMRYSLLAGGKRIRPSLCLACGRMLGASIDALMPFAAALEFIHTYSLIHDDLPAMDNDDLRRGRPTNHKVHGEALAILAGDALLTDAFGLMASVTFPAERVVRAIAFASACAGSSGMVGGQALDMEYTGRSGVTLEELRHMHAGKTGALLRAACVCGGILAGADEAHCAALSRYAAAFGACFQITDDILDETGDTAALGKTVGSDAANGKNTYPALVGLEESRRLAVALAEEAVAALTGFTGPDAEFLKTLAQSLATRSA